MASQALILLTVMIAGNGPAASGVSDDDRLAFQLTTVNGDVAGCQPADSERWTVICFLGAECPLARLYAPRLQRLADQFADQSVEFIGVYSNQQDSPGDIRHFAREHNLGFPSAKDPRNRVADQFQATRTPEVVVVDRHLQIRYRGRIDDQYRPGTARAQPEQHDLAEALADLVAHRVVRTAETEPQGCIIGRVKQPVDGSDVTFCNQVARILNQRCVECHRVGEIGPFALTDYDEVVGWADMIQEVIEDARMPPWHAAPHSIDMANARVMPDHETELIRRWVAAGAPFGDAEQLPSQPEFTDGWQLPREPDLVLPMRDRPFTVPEQGTVEYQYFVVDPGFETDRWISAAQVVPGNAAVVHHAIVFVRPPDGSRFRGVGWVTAYVPGQRVPEVLPGHARRIPARSKLVFQMHYTPNGDVQQDITKVGLVFIEESAVTNELFTVVGIEQEFEIPPYANEHVVAGRVRRFPRDGKLLAIMPHMHVRGKSFHLSTMSAAGTQLLLDVPRYDFNWQHVYQLREPLPLQDVDDLAFEAIFDNSAANPVNPDPSQYVTWGDQTWEEMAVAFFEVSEPRQTAGDGGREEPKSAESQRAVEKRTSDFVADFFRRFDQDDDGRIQRDETPIAFRRFGFRKFDSDEDQYLSGDEIRSYARQRFEHDQ